MQALKVYCKNSGILNFPSDVTHLTVVAYSRVYNFRISQSISNASMYGSDLRSASARCSNGDGLILSTTVEFQFENVLCGWLARGHDHQGRGVPGGWWSESVVGVALAPHALAKRVRVVDLSARILIDEPPQANARAQAHVWAARIGKAWLVDKNFPPTTAYNHSQTEGLRSRNNHRLLSTWFVGCLLGLACTILGLR